jgi:hypothetical protein
MSQQAFYKRKSKYEGPDASLLKRLMGQVEEQAPHFSYSGRIIVTLSQKRFTNANTSD